jgi:anion-transporting  ArsA/GET3 family ATPase
MSHQDPVQELLRKQLIICCGSGGVGKTTVAASIAVRGAREGLKVLVLTIDPARRLADSLGIGPLGNEEVPIPPQRLKAVGIPPGGELWALMLDAKRTFDGLVARFSPTSEIRERILNNRYYQQISGSMVGSQEYMAMERLLDIREKGSYDLIVLDTPPSRHALDFLRAPSRLRGVLEEGVLSWLLKPSSFLMSKVSERILGATEGGFLSNLEKVLGLGMIGDLSEFVISFRDLLTGFKLRAAKAQQVLRDAQTTFVLVTSPNQLAIREAAFFLEQLEHQGLSFGGFIINRTLPLQAFDPGSEEVRAVRHFEAEAWRRDFPAEPPPDVSLEAYETLLEKLRHSLANLLELAEIDRENLAWLKQHTREGHLFLQLPELPGDVHDLHGLDALGRLLSQSAR